MVKQGRMMKRSAASLKRSVRKYRDGVISEKANAILQKIISGFQKAIVAVLKKIVDLLNNNLKKNLEKVQAITNKNGVIDANDIKNLGVLLAKSQKTSETVIKLNQKIMSMTLDAQKRCETVAAQA